MVLTMTLLAVAFDISWFYGGLEQYSLIVLRNTAVKLVGIAMLFFIYPGKRRSSAVCGIDCGNRTSGKCFHVGIFKGAGGKAGFKRTASFAPI